MANTIYNFFTTIPWSGLANGALKTEKEKLPELCREVSFEFAGKTLARFLMREEKWTLESLESSFQEFVDKTLGTITLRSGLRIFCNILGDAIKQKSPETYNNSPSATVMISFACIAKSLLFPPAGLSRSAAVYNEVIDLSVLVASDVGGSLGGRIHPAGKCAGHLLASFLAEYVALNMKIQQPKAN